MYQLFKIIFLIIISILSLYKCDLNNDDDNHIEIYQAINRKINRIQATTSRPNTRFSIFQKRTRPLFRKNTKQETSLTDYKIINNEMKLNKTKASNEFVDIYDKKPIQLNNLLNDTLIDLKLSLAQQTMLAFEHGLKVKQQAKCDKPKPTVVYLNQNKEQIKIYLPRATILHRCGQNTGCCESESEQCVAIEQEQVNLYFFVIKLQKEFEELDNSELDKSIDKIDNNDLNDRSRKGRKFSVPFESNDDSILKEYEYNLDYSIGTDEFKQSNDNYDQEINTKLRNEKNYLNLLFNQDDLLKQRLSRSIRKGKELKRFSEDDLNNDNISTRSKNIAIIKRNLSDNEFQTGESKLNIDENNRYNTTNSTISSLNNRINSKRSSSYYFPSSSSSTYSTLTTKQSLNKIIINNNRNSNLNRRSLGGQLKPKQTIEVLTFTNHTKCGCVIKN